MSFWRYLWLQVELISAVLIWESLWNQPYCGCYYHNILVTTPFFYNDNATTPLVCLIFSNFLNTWKRHILFIIIRYFIILMLVSWIFPVWLKGSGLIRYLNDSPGSNCLGDSSGKTASSVWGHWTYCFMLNGQSQFMIHFRPFLELDLVFQSYQRWSVTWFK
jgi:hypothetical protein